ncbi:MAG: WD40 repeat domain-containing protein, partial [Cyanobacteria bacterium J06635_10]
MEYELPLLELFNRLREAGLPLGVDEYKLVLRALQAGFGIEDKVALANLCCTLWVKTSEEKLLFDYHFERTIAEGAFVFAAKSSMIEETNQSSEKITTQKWTQKLFKIPDLTSYLVLGSSLTLATGIIVFLVNSWMDRRCPNIISQPVENAIVNREYKYNIATCRDSDRDKIKITSLKKPDWLNLKDNGDGTATLSGTPRFNYYGIVNLWNTSGKYLATFSQKGGIGNTSFSPDGRFLATTLAYGSKPANLVQIWDISSQKQIKEFEYQARVKKIYFSPDSQYIAAILDNKTVIVRDISGKDKPVILAHQGIVESVSFSPDGQLIATASGDATVRLWNLQGVEQGVLWHKGRVSNAKFSPDGQYIATGTDDKKLIVWNISTRKQLRIFINTEDYWSNITFSADGKLLINKSNERTVSVWNIDSGKQIAKLSHDRVVRSFRLSFDGKYISTYETDGNYQNTRIRLWNINGKLVKELDLRKLQKEKIYSHNVTFSLWIQSDIVAINFFFL